MVWVDVTEGQDPNQPTNFALLQWYRSFLKYYAAQSGVIKPIHVVFDEWEATRSAPVSVHQYLRNSRFLRFSFSEADIACADFFENTHNQRRDQLQSNSYTPHQTNNHRGSGPQGPQERSQETRAREPRSLNREEPVSSKSRSSNGQSSKPKSEQCRNWLKPEKSEYFNPQSSTRRPVDHIRRGIKRERSASPEHRPSTRRLHSSLPGREKKDL
ncbi:hypothetical protein DL98DRAFT_589969 [Cadophora sp. DSE1049]|nr:hypothetical protein DL98DRAFT_589969 [Cadophora sp. DSE1049]